MREVLYMNVTKIFYQVKISGIMLKLNKNIFYENIQIFFVYIKFQIKRVFPTKYTGITNSKCNSN